MNAAVGASEPRGHSQWNVHSVIHKFRPAGAIQYVAAALKKVPDLRVTIEDMIAEDDKVVVRNHWAGTDSASKQRLEFSGIVIWRIANRQIVERWAYLESPHPASG